ncbi:hypothetical protein JCM17380_02240 [Desulfosporosinus burensis]|nr:MAG: hypothetical protein VR66_09810 [Peptococcaceae bacterium BRH_c23]
MKRLESLREERDRVIMTLEKENKNRVKLLIKLMDVDDEIEEILASELKAWPFGLVNNSLWLKPGM